MENTDTFVAHGISAGGLAVYSWIDYIRKEIHLKNNKVKVIGVPDSGFFIDGYNLDTDSNDYTIRLKTLFRMVTNEISFPN